MRMSPSQTVVDRLTHLLLRNTCKLFIRAAFRHFACRMVQMAEERQGQEASAQPAKKTDPEPLEPDSPGTATVTDRLERLKRALATLPMSGKCRTVHRGLGSVREPAAV